MLAACFWRAVQGLGPRASTWRPVPPHKAAVSLKSKRPGTRGRQVAGTSRPNFVKTGFKKKVAGPAGGAGCRGPRPGRGRARENKGKPRAASARRPVPGRGHKGKYLTRGAWAGPKGKYLAACILRLVPPPRPAAATSLESKRPGMRSRKVAGTDQPSFLKTGFKKKVAGPAGSRMPGRANYAKGEPQSARARRRGAMSWSQGQVPGGLLLARGAWAGPKGKCLAACILRLVPPPRPVAATSLKSKRPGMRGRKVPGAEPGTGQPIFVKTGFQKKVAGPAGGKRPSA